MIRGIFIASLIFFNLALAQQAPTEFVPSTCNISPNPGENSLNKGQIASQMINLGLAKPSEAQVRCIMNTPREGRKAKLQEMISGMQGPQQQPPTQVPTQNPPVGQGGPPPTLVQQYPQVIPFNNTQIIPLGKVSGDAKRMATTLGTQLLHLDVSNNNPTGYPGSIDRMQKPILFCQQSSQPCKLEFISAAGNIPFYKITGTYTIADNTSPIAFGKEGILLTKTLLENNHVMACNPTNTCIAIRFNGDDLSKVPNKNNPTLTCNTIPGNTCSLIRTGVTQAQPQKITYTIQGAYTIVDAEPAPGTPPNQGGTPGGTQQPQFLPEITFPKDTLIPVQRIGFSNQVVTKNNTPEYFMMIELAPDTLKSVQPGPQFNLKCTSETCKLTDSTRRTVPPEKPIYTVTTGTLVPADAPTSPTPPPPPPTPGPPPVDQPAKTLPILGKRQGINVGVDVQKGLLTSTDSRGKSIYISVDAYPLTYAKEYYARAAQQGINTAQLSLECNDGNEPCTLDLIDSGNGTPPVYKFIGPPSFRETGTFLERIVAGVAVAGQKDSEFIIRYSGNDVIDGVLVNTDLPSPLSGQWLKITNSIRGSVDFVRKKINKDLVVKCLDSTCAIKCDYPESKPGQCGTYGNYYLAGNYTIDVKPQALTLDNTGVIITPTYTIATKTKPRTIGYIYSDAMLNGQSIKIGLSKDLRDRINELNIIKDYDSLRLRCVDKAGCPLTGPDANGTYSIQGNAIITKPDDTQTTTINKTFNSNTPLTVTYISTTYEDVVKKEKPLYAVKYDNSTLSLPLSNLTNSLILGTTIAPKIVQSLVTKKPFTFKITCRSSSSPCFTVPVNGGVGSNGPITTYRFYGQFSMSE